MKILIFISALDEGLGQMVCIVLINRHQNSALGIYPRTENIHHVKSYTLISIAALFIMAKKVGTTKYLSAGEWRN